jgi:hypothetical protein
MKMSLASVARARLVTRMTAATAAIGRCGFMGSLQGS